MTSVRTVNTNRSAAWTAGWIEQIAELYMAHTAMGAAEPGSTAYTWAAAQFSAALNTIDAVSQMSHAALLHPAAAKVLATLDREWDVWGSRTWPRCLTGKPSRGRANGTTGAAGRDRGVGDGLTGPPLVTRWGGEG